MVCHRCCEIAVKLHKYRTNAVANDKSLKEKYGQPYTSPITDQGELLRIASNIGTSYTNNNNGNVIISDTESVGDPLELLNISIKKEIVSEYNGASASTCASSSNKLSDNKLLATEKKLPIAFNQRPPSMLPLRSAPKVKYRHSSITKLYQQYNDMLLPPEIMSSDISPVVSLDTAEVGNWYAEQLNVFKRRLSNVQIKKIPDASNVPIPSSPKCTEVTQLKASSEIIFKDRIVPLIIKKCATSTSGKDPSSLPIITSNIRIIPNSQPQAMKRTYRRILSTSDDDSDNGADREGSQPFDSSRQKENEVPQNQNEISQTQCENINHNEEGTNSRSLSNHKTASINSVIQSIQRSRKIRGILTSRKRTHHNTADNDVCEVMPQKKNRAFSDQNALRTTNILELPQQCPSDKKESSFELTTVGSSPLVQPQLIDEQNMMATGKSLTIFMCAVCNKIFDTKKELLRHKKTHLKCKFCKKIMRSQLVLEKHEKETCHINIVKNQPIVRAIKVDNIPEIVKKYSDAFEENMVAYPNLICNENIDFGKLLPNANQVLLPKPSDTSVIEGQLKIATGNEVAANQKLPVVCVSSDESDNEIQSAEIDKHKITTDQCEVPVDSTDQNPVQDSIYTFAVSTLSSETDMIRSLFTRHSKIEQKDFSSQTFVAADSNVRYTNSNLIILDDMFSDLSVYKILVHLESQTRISARFKEHFVPLSKLPILCWGQTKVVVILRPGLADTLKKSIPLPKHSVINRKQNNPVVINKFLNTNSLPELLSTRGNDLKVYNANKPTVSVASTSIHTNMKSSNSNLTTVSLPTSSRVGGGKTSTNPVNIPYRTPELSTRGNNLKVYNSNVQTVCVPTTSISTSMTETSNLATISLPTSSTVPSGINSTNPVNVCSSTAAAPGATCNGTLVPVTLTLTPTNNYISMPSSATTFTSGVSYNNSQQPNSFMQIVEPSSALRLVPYQETIHSQNSVPEASMNFVAPSYQQPDQVLHISNNITNLNQIFVVADGHNLSQSSSLIPHAQMFTPNLNNFINPSSKLPTYNESINNRISEITDNQISVITTNDANTQPAKNLHGIRVKNLWELNSLL